METFNHLPDTSRVWIYAGSKELGADQQINIKNMLSNFTSAWTSHQLKLHAAADLIHDRFLVFMVDESVAEVSGCGIDKSVQLVREIEQKTGLTFFNRLLIHIQTAQGVKTFTKAELQQAIEEGTLHENSSFFDLMVSNKAEFVNDWIKPLNKSWVWPKIKSLSA